MRSAASPPATPVGELPSPTPGSAAAAAESTLASLAQMAPLEREEGKGETSSSAAVSATDWFSDMKLTEFTCTWAAGESMRFAYRCHMST